MTPDRAALARAAMALDAFVEPLDLALNPENVDEVAYATLLHAASDHSPAEVQAAVRRQVADHVASWRRSPGPALTDLPPDLPDEAAHEGTDLRWERARLACVLCFEALGTAANPEDYDEMTAAMLTAADSDLTAEEIFSATRARIEARAAERERGRAVLATLTFVVRRMDDHGNVYDVSRHATREEAQARADELEARGHKQTYWVSEVPGV